MSALIDGFTVDGEPDFVRGTPLSEQAAIASLLQGQMRVEDVPRRRGRAKGKPAAKLRPADAPDDSVEATRTLIRHLFPTRFLELPGIRTALTYALPGAGSYVGGDIMDAYQLTSGAVSFAIADISGKGAAAAVNAALVKYAMRAYACEGFRPEKVLRSLNRLYAENNANEGVDSYLTAFFGLVDRTRRVLTYASAGHEPAIACRYGQAPLVLRPTAPMIAVSNGDDIPFEEASISLQPGTVLVLTTDGVTETRSPGGDLFGIERLQDCVRRNVDSSVEHQVERLLRETERFGGGGRHDDVAILIASFT